MLSAHDRQARIDDGHEPMVKGGSFFSLREKNMTRRRVAIVLLLGTLLAGLFALGIGVSYHRHKPAAELRYLRSGQVNAGGYVYFGSTFWVSNCSDNTIMITLRAIETKTPSGGSVYTNAVRVLQTLPPHQAGHFIIDSPPADGAWRLRVDACSQMKGLAAYWSFGKLYWGDLRYRLRSGRAARPWPPFGVPIYDRTAELTSQDITD